jgi:hypothetical protein
MVAVIPTAQVDRIAGDFGQGIVATISGISLEGAGVTVTLFVKRPNGTTQSWATTIDAVNNRATHLFADGDIPVNVPGNYRVQAIIDKTTPPSRTRTLTAIFTVGVAET